MFTSIFGSAAKATLTLPTFTVAVVVALVLGLVSAFVYLKTFRSTLPPQKFAVTLVVLPVVIAIIIMLVGNNIARAFSLAGAFSIIRFRSAPGDPNEITFVLYTMAVGLAAGMGYPVFAVITAVIILLVIYLLSTFNFGGDPMQDQILKVVLSENDYYRDDLEEAIDKYTSYRKLKRIKTTELGSLFEVQYLIQMKKGSDERAMLDEIRAINGNLTIAMQYQLIPDDY